jgi:hypothetical protein
MGKLTCTPNRSHDGEWYFVLLAQFSPSYLVNAQMHQMQGESDLGRSGDGPSRDLDLQCRVTRVYFQNAGEM